ERLRLTSTAIPARRKLGEHSNEEDSDYARTNRRDSAHWLRGAKYVSPADREATRANDEAGLRHDPTPVRQGADTAQSLRSTNAAGIWAVLRQGLRTR